MDADIDADGDLDAFVANRNTTANIVWINQGGIQGGTMGQFFDSGQRLGNSDSRGVSLGDLDNDGDIDAFVINRGEGQPNLVWLNQHGLADFDDDGDVDAADFLMWQAGFGLSTSATRAHGDGNDDEAVDGEDLEIWQRLLGTTAPFQADFNQDNNIDAGDFLTWQRGMGSSGATLADGDANRSGVVDGDDLDVWQRQYGTTDLFQIADFDEDADVDGADFLSLQRGFGVVGASAVQGDSNGDHLVDRKDWNVWRLQYGTVELPQSTTSDGAHLLVSQFYSEVPGSNPRVENADTRRSVDRAMAVTNVEQIGLPVSHVATSSNAQSDQYATEPGVTTTTIPAPLPALTHTFIWWQLPYREHELTSFLGTHRVGPVGPVDLSTHHTDHAMEQLYPGHIGYGSPDSRERQFRENPLAQTGFENHAGLTEEEVDAVVIGWDG